ncbi:MAG: signal peptidase I [Clostridia bacterium]
MTENKVQENTDMLIENPQNNNPRRKQIVAIVSVLVVIVLAFICASLVKYFVVATFTVNGISMYPTLDGGNGASNDNDEKNGETLYLNKVAKIKRNDIVVFKPNWADINGKSVVKRVIGIAGDHVQVVDNQVFLNGKRLDENYINEQMINSPDIDVVVPDGNIVCFGDNRNHSEDCRFNAPYYVALDTVVGRCFMIKSLDGKIRSL